MGNFKRFGLILGINMHYFMIYALFFLLRLVSACMSFDCRFMLNEPSVRRKDVELRPNEFKRASKRGPIGPKTAGPRKKLWSKATPVAATIFPQVL